MIATVVKIRRLPAQGRVTVHPGDRVEPTTIVGRVDYIPGQLYKHDVAVSLALHPKHLTEVMSVDVGGWVEAGDTLATTDEFFIERRATAEHTGAIGLVSRTLGNVFVREPLPVGASEPVTVQAGDTVGAFWFSNNIVVRLGQTVEPGQILVQGSLSLDLGGTNKPRIQPLPSPIFGKVTDIQVRSRSITISPLRRATEVRAHISGMVTGVVDGESVEISSHGHVIYGVIGFGGEHTGKLTVLRQAASRDVDICDLPEDLAGRVVVGRNGIAGPALARCLSEGAAGVILGSADRRTLRDLFGSDPVQALGVAVEPGATVILTNGFGSLPMADRSYSELVSLDGQLVSIDGSTQLRAGVVRPEIFVAADSAPTAVCVEPETDSEGVNAGDRVMIVREPGFGVIGRVTSISSAPERLPSGVWAVTATVQGERTGEPLTIPLANMKPLGGAGNDD